MTWTEGPVGWWMHRLLLLLLAGSAVSLLALGARWSVFLELFAHFRLQYLVMQLLAVLLALVLRRPDLVTVLLLMAVPHAMAVAPYVPGLLEPPPAAPGPRIVALNLQYNNEDFARALAYLQATDADVLVLSEFTPRAEQRLRSLEARYPYRVYRPRYTAWGLGVYSRRPLSATEDLALDRSGSEQLRLRVELPGGPLDVYAVHLASPTRPARGALRDAQLRALAARVRTVSGAEPAVPRLIVGDLNLTPYSPAFDRLLAAAGVTDARRPQGLHVTWPTWRVPLWIPIDHCLAGGPVQVMAVTTGPAMGSDHLPLEIRLAGGSS